MAKAKTGRRSRTRPKLSAADVGRQHAAELPEREAMSLILPSTGGLPMVGGTDPTAAAPDGGGYTAGAQQTALDQTSSAQQLATSPPAGGANVPNGTATSTARS
ncbi:MAG TPA: hypothetical protein VGL23_14995 [Chloroflexota bacterium]|jgi:hypothetical protein